MSLRDATPAMVAASHSPSSIKLPDGIRLIGLDSHSAREASLAQVSSLQTQAIATHHFVHERMRAFGRAANRDLVADPMNGRLSNLDPDDYKRFFRPTLSERDQHVADHFVLEPKRVREFVRALEKSSAAAARTRESGKWLDRAGHLMYASDFSYRHDAMISSPECEFLVDAAHARERSGIYGARIAGNGAADGIVVILADEGPTVDAAIEQIADDYFSRFAKRIARVPLLTNR